jgi:hypothetical protein
VTTEGSHGTVAEEIAALAEALRMRAGGTERTHTHSDTTAGIDVCEVCPVCRAIAMLHTVSPAAVTALADLAHQAEVTLRTLAADLATSREESAATPPREDIPVDDLDHD